MIMMVLNKGKLKKLIIFILIILLILCGIAFTLKKNQTTPSINILDLAKAPYTQGTKKNSGYVALTCNVDLGWEDEYVISILETLKREKVHITFNVTGKWAENKKNLLLRIKNEGHEIGNHGHKHSDYANLSYDENYNQISTSKKIIDNAIGEETKFFQAPAGSFGSNTVKAAQRLNYICFKWDVDTIDWQDRDNPEKIIERVKNKNIVDGSIVLMHPTDATAKCIDDIIQIIRQKNLKPGRLSDVFVVD
ncbi:polysaccharide deacetylase family protein [Terrisporobacter petrolearius]|uniref:polysaccharide deacetylase family protein n=1 Tax=Terrisporobacter petrolearius TaxID=1460447 RepID=UPI001D16E467|nr:polysaccharide deacetylase family protein [Terrisporobacter petrolearius]MCC3864887.1 polysaccharide deacetylase family protein [Terrisporobacter petrolearius]